MRKAKITDKDEWYCSLSPKEKEQVAYHAIKAYNLDKEDDPMQYHYPESTTVWLALDKSHKKEVYNHFKACKIL